MSHQHNVLHWRQRQPLAHPSHQYTRTHPIHVCRSLNRSSAHGHHDDHKTNRFFGHHAHAFQTSHHSQLTPVALVLRHKPLRHNSLGLPLAAFCRRSSAKYLVALILSLRHQPEQTFHAPCPRLITALPNGHQSDPPPHLAGHHYHHKQGGNAG